ncbi:hypothetical protein IHE44_0009231 [Lamprotornis superbus]|uniref:Potassium channel domain-containing protein n=1 Tax=Lamprotornis superbus TaxID=245042 RepID=A0A835NZQ8_9PASS|nr:hypothetical protein IHE44_0009231 [Lamprotornis superbus]
MKQKKAFLVYAGFTVPFCGYGHTVPLSDGGKAFCIIYSVIGIPFTLLFLTAVVQRIVVYVTRRPVLYFHIRWGFSKQVVAIIHAMVLGFITVSCFFLIPAAIFSVLEDDWNFLESFYFCFISLSTIGLGDYVPGEGYNQKFRELYKIGITCYLLMGLIAMLVVLETFCELHELKKFRKLFYVKKDKEEDQVHIMEHDQLSFSSISDQAASMKDDQKANEPFVKRCQFDLQFIQTYQLKTVEIGMEPFSCHNLIDGDDSNHRAEKHQAAWKELKGACFFLLSKLAIRQDCSRRKLLKTVLERLGGVFKKRIKIKVKVSR